MQCTLVCCKATFEGPAGVSKTAVRDISMRPFSNTARTCTCMECTLVYCKAYMGG